MNRKFAALVILALGFAAGCHAQVPPASPGYQVVLTATAPVASGNWAGCTTSNSCVYAFYAETITGSTCDPTTSANYKEITTPTARPSTPTFTDANTTGLTRCYDVETVQSVQNSAPSNVAGPVVSPGIPLAPALQTPTPSVSEVVNPVLQNSPPASQLAKKLPPPSGLAAIAKR